MIVVGGTYVELCFEPIWNQIYGSGFRAVNVILENSTSETVDFFTCVDKIETENHLAYYSTLNTRLTNHISTIDKSPEFRYDHPLKAPIINPRPDILAKSQNTISANGKHILAYGMIEALINVEGEKVVYDPQSPVNPLSFSSTGSTAEQLVMIVNQDEAQKISGTSEINEIKKYFFEVEKCFAVVIKMGAKGAVLFQGSEDIGINIPVYKTEKIWNIGSGDVFSAYFALNWFQGMDLAECAVAASKATAIYCNSKALTISPFLIEFKFSELLIKEKPSGLIYLAGPFFTFTQRWLINEVRTAFKSIELNIFSPFHDVGHGKAIDVVEKDIEGLDKSEVVFAIIDGLDSGTLFEVGYAIAQGKKVIAFTQNESEEAIKMLEGTNCIIENDLTTAIYKTYWNLAN